MLLPNTGAPVLPESPKTSVTTTPVRRGTPEQP
jgi:hypothetical protein